MTDFLLALIFFLPAGLANASPIFANKIPILNRWEAPLDFGKSYKGMRIFGEHKTWRGVLFGVVIGGLTVWLERKVWWEMYPTRSSLWLSVERMMHFSSNYLLVGCLLAFGALLGDAIESFFKRRKGIESGKSWFPFDQTDYIIGGLLVVSPLVIFTLKGYLIILAVWTGMHLIGSYVGYIVGLKERPI
jgi:CDP-2,3-bis-(O-geranylgeranyl)-sn-glycerol synthase